MLKTNMRKGIICMASALLISGLYVNAAYAEENEPQVDITVEVSENTAIDDNVSEAASGDIDNEKSETIDIIEINSDIIAIDETYEEVSSEAELSNGDVSTEAARYVYVIAKTVELSKTSSGAALCKVSIACNPSVTKMIGAVILYDDTADGEKASWSINTSGSYNLNQTITVASGHTYSLKLYAELYTSSSSSKVESIDGISTRSF